MIKKKTLAQKGIALVGTDEKPFMILYPYEIAKRIPVLRTTTCVYCGKLANDDSKGCFGVETPEGTPWQEIELSKVKVFYYCSNCFNTQIKSKGDK